jgi:hypothetical protein
MSIQPKLKICRGSGKAKGFDGCGKPTLHRVYGLGKMCGCYSKWLLNTDAGKLKLSKAIGNVQKPRLELEKAEKERKTRSALKQAHNHTKILVHAYVRERDKYKPCISCGCNWHPDFQAGHHYKAELYETLKYDLDNISGQCVKCNIRKDGNFSEYALRLPNRIGIERYNILVGKAEIDKQQSKVWTVENLKEIQQKIKSLTIGNAD